MTGHVAGASQRRAKSGPLANVVAVLMAGGARHPFLAAEHAPPPQAVPHGARPQAALSAGSRASPPPGGLAGPPLPHQGRHKVPDVGTQPHPTTIAPITWVLHCRESNIRCTVADAPPPQTLLMRSRAARFGAEALP